VELAPLVRSRLVEIARDDPRILAVVEGGSTARGESDEWSDLDVALVCTDEGRPELVDCSVDLASRLAPLLTSYSGDHVGLPRMRMCLFGPPLLHVDLDFVTLGELGEGVVLWECEPGLAGRAAAPASGITVDAQWIEDRFWSWVHYLAAKGGRGAVFDCVDGLAYLRSIVFGPMLAVRYGRRPQGVDRVEQYAGPALEELGRTLGGTTREACLDAVHAAVALYRRLRDEQQAPGLVRRSEAEEASLDYLSEVQRAAHDRRT
jgi:predicted nucleotidyltransferase